MNENTQIAEEAITQQGLSSATSKGSYFKGSDVIISIHDTSFIVFYPWYKFYTNKVLSCSSSYKVDVVI